MVSYIAPDPNSPSGDSSRSSGGASDDTSNPSPLPPTPTPAPRPDFRTAGKPGAKPIPGPRDGTGPKLPPSSPAKSAHVEAEAESVPDPESSTPESAVKATPEDAAKVIAEDAVEATTDDAVETTSEHAPKTTLEATPKVKPEETPKDAPEASPEEEEDGESGHWINQLEGHIRESYGPTHDYIIEHSKTALFLCTCLLLFVLGVNFLFYGSNGFNTFLKQFGLQRYDYTGMRRRLIVTKTFTSTHTHFLEPTQDPVTIVQPVTTTATLWSPSFVTMPTTTTATSTVTVVHTPAVDSAGVEELAAVYTAISPHILQGFKRIGRISESIEYSAIHMSHLDDAVDDLKVRVMRSGLPVKPLVTHLDGFAKEVRDILTGIKSYTTLNHLAKDFQRGYTSPNTTLYQKKICHRNLGFLRDLLTTQLDVITAHFSTGAAHLDTIKRLTLYPHIPATVTGMSFWIQKSMSELDAGDENRLVWGGYRTLERLWVKAKAEKVGRDADWDAGLGTRLAKLEELFFEVAKKVDADKRILKRMGSAWEDPTLDL